MLFFFETTTKQKRFSEEKKKDEISFYLGFGVLGLSSFFILSLFERLFGVDGLFGVLNKND